MSEIRHVVFDVGNVLLHYNPDYAYRAVITDAAERAWFLANVCSPEWNKEQDRGRSWQEAEDVLIAEHPDREAHIRAYRENWTAMVPHALTEQVAIMMQLIERGADVTLLTNFNDETFAVAREIYPFLNAPRGATVSGEVRYLKPDREIYDHHVTTFRLEPAATIFIDDSKANVAAAIAAGWQAVHFTDTAGLQADLQGHGVL